MKAKKRPNKFKFKPFSKQQQRLIHWWRPGLVSSENDFVIADGSIRSGKTIACIIGFLTWSQEMFEGESFILAGKTMGALKKNVVRPMLQILEAWGWSYTYIRLNLTNTTMLHKAQEAFKTLVQNTAEEAMKIMNNNTGAVITGAESRQQALRKTIRQFNDNGIAGFVDKRGRNWTPEAYVNMTMRTTAGSVANEVQTARCEDMGVNLIQIDSHSGARPKCAKDQGKIFSLDNTNGTTEDLNGRKIRYYPWNSSSYGEPDGILGINCGHHKYPFIPGVNIQRYFPTEDMDANNRLYKQTQVQRALEREVRKQKRVCMLFDELGDSDAFEEASVKLKSKEAQLKDYVKKHDHLHRRKDREQVVGFDKRVSADTVNANKNSIRIASERSQYREYLKSLKERTVTLRREQKKILEKVINVGDWAEFRKKQIDVKDLAALTAATGHEFALFTGKSSKIVVHGTSQKWHIPYSA